MFKYNDIGPKYDAEVSYYDIPRNKKRYVVLREHSASFQIVQDMIEDVLDKVSKGAAELRHIHVYSLEDYD